MFKMIVNTLKHSESFLNNDNNFQTESKDIENLNLGIKKGYELTLTLKHILSELYNSSSNTISYTFFIAAGRRILFTNFKTNNLNTYSLEDSINLISGRRIRIYHLLQKNQKQHLKFGWAKMQILNKKDKQELLEIMNQGNQKIFNKAFLQFCLSIGGEFFPYRLLKQHIHTNSTNMILS